MLLKLKQKLMGWKFGDAADYRAAHNLYGGGTITHPDILDFIHARINCDPHYLIKRAANGELTGAFCTWGTSFFAGEHQAAEQLKVNAYPLPFDELILPLAPTMNALIPFKTKSLSILNKKSLLNASYKINSNRQICLAKSLDAGGFSAKTKARRNKEVKDFIAAGGEIRQCSEYNASEFAEIYSKVFKKRRGCEPDNLSEIVDIFNTLKNHIFGHVLLLDGEACAIQLITKADSPNWISFDYINGGFDTDMSSLCLGTIVTWLNIKAAFEICRASNKAMRYSFGKPTADYKERWCYFAPLARSISI